MAGQERVSFTKDTIKQIIEMDRKAREITEAARQEELDSEKEIRSRCEEIRKNYLEKARKRLSINEQEERAAAEAQWKEKEKRYQELTQEMEDTYAQNADAWVDRLVAGVLETT